MYFFKPPLEQHGADRYVRSGPLCLFSFSAFCQRDFCLPAAFPKLREASNQKSESVLITRPQPRRDTAIWHLAPPRSLSRLLSLPFAWGILSREQTSHTNALRLREWRLALADYRARCSSWGFVLGTFAQPNPHISLGISSTSSLL